jgi:hypothetical protein
MHTPQYKTILEAWKHLPVLAALDDDGNLTITNDRIWWLEVAGLHPSCGLDRQPEWVIFHEFMLMTRLYIRMVTDIRPEWYMFSLVVMTGWLTGSDVQ